MDMDMDGIRVRSAEFGDAEVIAAFNEALAWQSEAVRLDPVVTRAGVEAALRDVARGPYFLAETGGPTRRVIGQAQVTTEWSDWRNGWHWWFQSVYVDAAFRGRGVFRMLFEHVAAEARAKRDVVSLRLYVHEENANAVTCYRRLGMTDGHYRVMELPIRDA